MIRVRVDRVRLHRAVTDVSCAALWAAVAAVGLVQSARGTPLPQSASNPSQEPVYKYDTHGIRLEGRLIERTFLGPPGFGETPAQDVREKVLVLVLPRAISVEPAERAQPEDVAKHIRQIQLLILPQERKDSARKLLGKNVVVTGILNEATAPSEHLKVSMTVETFALKDSTEGGRPWKPGGNLGTGTCEEIDER